jgi:gamma-glutamyltranspeptidase / glutathione hydrolase
MLLLRLLTVVLIAIVLFDPQIALAQGKQPKAIGSGGAAATVDALATQAAIDTLRDGGKRG